MPYVSQSVAMTLTGATKTVTKPAGVRAGDVMVFWVVTDGNNSTFNVTFPLGWRRLDPRVWINLTATSGDSGGIQIAVKTATSNEPADYTANIVPTITANSGGIYVLRGVTTQNLQVAPTFSRRITPVPMGFPLHGLQLRVPSEVLWIANADITVSANVTFTPPAGFKLLGDHQSGFNNIALAHARYMTAGHTGALSGYATATSSNITNQGYVLAFPIMPVRPSRLIPSIRTLRPQWDVANTNWSAV